LDAYLTARRQQVARASVGHIDLLATFG
jgi:hypothetical protein